MLHGRQLALERNCLPFFSPLSMITEKTFLSECCGASLTGGRCSSCWEGCVGEEMKIDPALLAVAVEELDLPVSVKETTEFIESVIHDTLPYGLKEHVGSFRACSFDSHCGEAIGWGYPIHKRLGEELWSKVSQHGDMWCSYPNWYLITHWMTPKEAMKKYGKITSEERGPRGGFRSVTYGSKTFSSKHLDPSLLPS